MPCLFCEQEEEREMCVRMRVYVCVSVFLPMI